jgi:speckle-type POZ protein
MVMAEGWQPSALETNWLESASAGPDVGLKASSTTLTKVDETTFDWTINNFRFLLDFPTGFHGEIVSKSFYAGQYKWRLHMYPGGVSAQHKDYVSLLLSTKSPRNAPVALESTMSIDSPMLRRPIQTRESRGKLLEGYALGKVRLIKREVLLTNLQEDKDDVIHVSCHLKVLTHVPLKKEVVKPEKSTAFLQHFAQMLDSGDFSDVTLVCQGKTFRCHKVVLAGRSSVFRAMFQTPMRESLTSEVHFPDMSADVLEQMINFIYTGTLKTNVQALAFELFEAACEYDLDHLRQLSRISIKSNLNKHNVCQVLALADRHDETDLKEAAIMYIVCKGVNKLAKTNEWKELQKSFPHLATEVETEEWLDSLSFFRRAAINVGAGGLLRSHFRRRMRQLHMRIING